MRDVLTTRKIRLAEDHLRASDPVMASIIKTVGRCGLVRSKREDPFVAIVEAIVWQQLSGKAARTIYDRVLKVFPGGRPTPTAILATSDEAMRAAGLSRGKIAYLRDLSTKVLDGTVHLESLETMTNDEVVASMTRREVIRIEQDIVIEKNVVDSNHTVAMQRHIIKKRRACVELHIKSVVQVVVEICPCRNNPIHKARFH